MDINAVDFEKAIVMCFDRQSLGFRYVDLKDLPDNMQNLAVAHKNTRMEEFDKQFQGDASAVRYRWFAQCEAGKCINASNTENGKVTYYIRLFLL